jgi:hypothetical protein
MPSFSLGGLRYTGLRLSQLSNQQAPTDSLQGSTSWPDIPGHNCHCTHLYAGSLGSIVSSFINVSPATASVAYEVQVVDSLHLSLLCLAAMKHG